MAVLTHRAHEERPWGAFDRFAHNELTTVKLITVNPGKRFSLQYHEHRSEFWRVVKGDGRARIGEAEFPATVGSEFEIPEGTLHRMTGGEGGVTFLEVATGKFDEKDIVRVDDDFGRA